MGWEVRSAPAKAGLVVGLWALALLSGLAVYGVLGASAGFLIEGLVIVAGVYSLCRVFRGENEPWQSKRSWWRMTAHPRAGYVLACLFLVQGISIPAVAPHGPLTWFAVAANVWLAAAFLASSVTLTARTKHE